MVVIWGWVCALAGTFASLPQVVRLLRAGTSDGVSLLMWQLLLGVGIGWTAHGFTVGHANVVVPNLASALFSACVVAMVQRDRGLPSARVWPLGIIVGIASIAVEQFGSSALFGIVVIIPIAIGALGQTRDLLRSPDITGLSGSYMVVAFVLQGMWLSWGLAAGDISIQICASAVGLLAGINLVLWLARVRGVSFASAPVPVPEDAVV